MDTNALWNLWIPTVGGFFGATLGAYWRSFWSESAKIEATQENIGKVLAHVQFNTEVTKRIESAFSHSAWRAQMLWQDQKKAYTAALTCLDEAVACTWEVASKIAARHDEYSLHLTEHSRIHAKLLEIGREIEICGSPEAQKILEKVTGQVSRRDRIDEAALEMMALYREAKVELTHVASRDLYGNLMV